MFYLNVPMALITCLIILLLFIYIAWQVAPSRPPHPDYPAGAPLYPLCTPAQPRLIDLQRAPLP